MSRHEETMGVVSNPSQFYLEWNSELKSFFYYDKDAAEDERRKTFPLPFRFLALKFMNCITGYDNERQQGIYSNEIFNSRTETLRVAYRDGQPIARGYYAAIKDTVKASQGKFTRSIYAMSPKGAIINIKLKGSQMLNFGTIEKFGKRWQDEWIQVSSFETKVYEGQEYTVPVFTFGGTVNVVDSDRANACYDILKNYFDSKANFSTPAATTPEPAAKIPEASPVLDFSNMDDDDLPF